MQGLCGRAVPAEGAALWGTREMTTVVTGARLSAARPISPTPFDLSLSFLRAAGGLIVDDRRVW
jgi:hypothetical protein